VLPRRAVGQAARAHGYPWLPAVTADDAAESAAGLSAGSATLRPAAEPGQPPTA